MALSEKANLWRKYFDAKSKSEKEAILKKILPDITDEEMKLMQRKVEIPPCHRDEYGRLVTWDGYITGQD